MATFNFTAFAPGAFTFPGGGGFSIGNQFQLDPGWDAANDGYGFEFIDSDNVFGSEPGDRSDISIGQRAIVTDSSGTIVSSGSTNRGVGYSFVDEFGERVTLYEVEVEGTLVGYVADGPIQPGNTYTVASTVNPVDKTSIFIIRTGVNVTFDDLHNETHDAAAANTVQGTANADTLTTGAGSDTVQAGAGDDNISGGDGADLLRGGDGADTIIGGTGRDSLFGGTGDDRLVGGADGVGDDFFLGADFGNDTIIDEDDFGLLDTRTEDVMSDLAVRFEANFDGTLSGDEGTVTFEGIQTVVTGSGDDSINAEAVTESVFIDAGDGRNTVFGGDGNDDLRSGTGDDSLFGGRGDDFFATGGGSDTISTDGGSDTVFAEDDADLIEIEGGFNGSQIFGGEGVTTGTDRDTLDTGALAGGVTIVHQTSESGTLVSGADRLSFQDIEVIGLTAQGDNVDASTSTRGVNYDGLGGDDTLIGGAGADTLAGGDGDDFIEGGAGDDFLTTGLGQDTLDGGAGNDTLLNSDGDDLLVGGEGDDSIVATGGEDTLIGGTGDDYLEGGDDADTFFIEDNFGNDTIVGGEGVTDLSDIDFDTITLSTAIVPVIVTFTNAEAGRITDGTDTINFSEIEHVITTRQADFVEASPQSGTIGISVDTRGGNDTISGGDNDDTIVAGAGEDNVVAGGGADIVNGGTGNDAIDGGTGDDTIDGGADDDFIFGFDGNDSLIGGSGNDTIRGQQGNDTIRGGAGNDLLDGDDTAAGADVISGGDGNDTLTGGGGNDTLDGGADDDTIFAGAGNDSLTGGTGNDLLSGGDGNDIFTYVAGDGSDIIIDFNTGNTGMLDDGDSTNNDFIDLRAFYDNLEELRADHIDDGRLNQSNAIENGGNVDYTNNSRFATGEGIIFSGVSPTSFTTDNTGVVCFASGTMILTARGEVPIEQLRAGDLVQTRDNGMQPIVWIASRSLSGHELEANPKLKPIWISPKLTGGDQPLIVSPQHGVLLRVEGSDETLVRAVHLARMRGGQARVMQGCRTVQYFHLMFEAHQIIFANGAPAESFYPGPHAFGALSSAARTEIETLFPGFDAARTLDHYGSTIRDISTFRNLPRHLSALEPAHV